MRSVIVGGGHAAYFAITTLREIDFPGEITIIETTIEKAEVAKKQFPFAEVLNLEIDEIGEFLKMDRKEIDVFVTCTGSDALNLKLAKQAKEAGIPKVVSVVNNPLNEVHFKKAGIELIIDPFSLIGIKLKELFAEASPVKLYEGMEKRVALYAVKAPRACKLKAEIDPSCVLVLVKRRQKVVTGLDDVGKGDTIYVIGEARKAKKLASEIAKELRGKGRRRARS